MAKYEDNYNDWTETTINDMLEYYELENTTETGWDTISIVANYAEYMD